MPADTNPHGDIFGCWLMSQMDLAAGNVAARISRGRAATVRVETMSFLNPVFVGDEVSLYVRLAMRGRTSMKIEVEAWRRSRKSEETVKVTRRSSPSSRSMMRRDGRGVAGGGLRPAVMAGLDPAIHAVPRLTPSLDAEAIAQAEADQKEQIAPRIDSTALTIIAAPENWK